MYIHILKQKTNIKVFKLILQNINMDNYTGGQLSGDQLRQTMKMMELQAQLQQQEMLVQVFNCF